MFSAAGSVDNTAADEDGDQKKSQANKFTDEAGLFSRPNTKAVLINTGEKIVSALHDILTESAEQEGGVYCVCNTSEVYVRMYVTPVKYTYVYM